MKIRNGFVSNSSSSSFVLLKDSITAEQKDMILNYQKWVKFFLDLEKGSFVEYEDAREDYEKNSDKLKYIFEYYNDSWYLEEFDNFIFGSTGMDNFRFQDYFEHIKVDQKYSSWEETWGDTEPTSQQKAFISKMKKKFRKDKLDKINKSNK
jgi:hypothetical protein